MHPYRPYVGHVGAFVSRGTSREGERPVENSFRTIFFRIANLLRYRDLYSSIWCRCDFEWRSRVNRMNWMQKVLFLFLKFLFYLGCSKSHQPQGSLAATVLVCSRFCGSCIILLGYCSLNTVDRKQR